MLPQQRTEIVLRTTTERTVNKLVNKSCNSMNSYSLLVTVLTELCSKVLAVKVIHG